MAPLWVEYGDALIRYMIMRLSLYYLNSLYEENASLMGSKMEQDVRREAKKAAAELGDLLKVEEADTEVRHLSSLIQLIVTGRDI